MVSNTNEHQVSIGETTFGGLEVLDGSDGGPDFGPGRVKAVCNETYGCMDYGSIIYVTLQRAKTAREAISVIDDLMQTYGYASSGESFSIADPREVWLMEIIGKGNYSQGAVWVATRIPDGFVSAHANQARTRTFPWNNPQNVRYSKDVAAFARRIGVYNGTDADFSFSDVYDPVTFEGARFCEARVFSFFVQVAAPEEDIGTYLRYVQGHDLSHRMPLYVKASRKLSVNETMWHMRNHYEGTWFDPRSDVGAGAWQSPYRLGGGATWTYSGSRYVNERFIGTEKAAMNIVANQRPAHRYGVLWFGADDSTFSLHTPLYGATARLPRAWDGGNCTGRAACREAFGLPGSITKFSLESMHWVQQMVSNFAYSRYDVIGPAVQSKLAELEGHLFQTVSDMDVKLMKMTSEEAAAAATDFSFQTGERLHAQWLEFYGRLFATYVDGYRTVSNPRNKFSGCDKEPLQFSEAWKQRIVEETGDHYRVSKQVMGQKRGAISKFRVLAIGEACSHRDDASSDGGPEVTALV